MEEGLLYENRDFDLYLNGEKVDSVHGLSAAAFRAEEIVKGDNVVPFSAVLLVVADTGFVLSACTDDANGVQTRLLV